MRVLRSVTKKTDIEKIKDNFYVFDVETTKLEPQSKNFVFGVLYGWNFTKVIKTVKDFRDTFKTLKKCYVFAHNAEFDLLTIFGNIYTQLDNKAVFNGKFISCKFGNITFADSLNIYPASVEKIGQIIGMSKGENEKIRNEGLTKENMNQDDINYCIRDCEIIFNALLEIFENVGAIKITISSLAMYDYRKNYIANNVQFSDLVDEFYESYYGGRTECFYLGNVEAEVHDINSLYPTIMNEITFPDIKNLKKEINVDVKYLKYLIKYKEGLAKVKIKHNETYFGFIPIRYNNKLLFPVGIFTTVVNFIELRYALEKNVIEILEVEYVVYGNPIKSPFENFVQDNYNKRKNSQNELEKLILKLKLNSLYGRFAMRMKFETTYHDLIPFEIIKELKQTEKFYELKIFSQVRNDCYLITENDKFKNSFFAIPVYSSYITSGARLRLLSALLENENNKVVYCDTDSIFSIDGFNGDIGTELGQWKKEDKFIRQINGLKNYVYEEKGEIKEVIKGISKRAEKLKDGRYKTTQYFKTKEAIVRNKEAGSKKIIFKELKHTYDKRIVHKDGLTSPIKLNEL